MKNLNKFFNSVQFAITLSVLINIAIFVVLMVYVELYVYMLLCVSCLILFCFFTMFSKNQPSVKFMIALLMAILPLTATVIYSVINIKRGNNSHRKEWKDIRFNIGEKLIQNDSVFDSMEKVSAGQIKLSKYVYASTHMPVYANSSVTYFPKSDKFIEELLADLKTAKKFILISLFKVAKSDIWDEFFAILKEKRLSGVEVKLVYDDYGCVKTFKDKLIFEKLRNHGIETLCFNKLKGVGNFIHYRNKKNLVIIDNTSAFCSSLGINEDVLLDAKISKMCAVKIKGEAIKSIFAEFYSDWMLFSKTKLDWKRYAPMEEESGKIKSQIFIQPFISTPFSQDLVNKSVYACLIANANKSIVLSTPYLLLDEELKNELIRAVRSGVDVKILVAGKGERTKKCKFALSRNEFIRLIKEGIKIYSYSTDNLFNRSIVADAKTAIIGGGAFDSRKTSIHFEHGTLIHSEEIAKQVKDDIEGTMEVSHLLTIKDMCRRRIGEKFLSKLLNIFSPFYL